MAHPARGQGLTRRSWLLAGLGFSVSARALGARNVSTLVLHLDGDVLYVAAPDLHFLTGKPLERLKAGDAVVYLAQLSLSFDGNHTISRRQPQRFTFSYDLWEEKFSVASGSSTRKRSLTPEKAEAWCLDSLAISISGIPPDKPVWLRLDLGVADPKDPAQLAGDTGLSLRRLIDTFGRPARAEQPHWTLEQGPFRLGDLKKAVQGSRSG
jgi:hypothetical protein